MNKRRLHFLQISIFIYFFIVLGRLFFWQILKGPSLRELALAQTLTIEKIAPIRGGIHFSDGSSLALSQESYRLSLYKPNLKEDPYAILNKINQVSPDFITKSQSTIDSFLSNSSQKWITFKQPFTYEQTHLLDLPGVTFQNYATRLNPEGNLAKVVSGYTRQDEIGNIFGISGLEGYYNKQLTGRNGYFYGNQDATGQINLAKKWLQISPINGQDIETSLNRGVQSIIETTLKNGLDKYSADSGSIIIMEPSTGQILALSSLTNSVIATASATPTATPSATKNIAIADLFEPGSIFKPLVVSMALDHRAITPDYICHQCDRPHTIGQYTISNWDNALHPESTLQDIIKNSDNIGMSYIIGQLGEKSFLKYFDAIGMTNRTGIDLQGEARPLPKNDWPDIDLATASFGQGFAINQVQMVRGFNVIANNGYLVTPRLRLVKNPSTSDKIFSETTINEIKSILKYAVENGVTAKFKPDNLEVCAKSGTAQVAVKGSYTDSSTIASYIGFSPCQNPKFTMIVTINNPRTSPWGSSTAAPIWYEIASRIRYLL